MALSFSSLLIVPVLLTVVCGQESNHGCSEYATEYQIYEDEKEFNFTQNITEQFPITITFSDVVSNITSSSVQAKMLKPDMWLLELPTSQDENSTSPIEPLNIRVSHNSSEMRIQQIVVEERTVCKDLDIKENLCEFEGDILHLEATAPTTKKFHLRIPSNSSFAGYIVDVFFTKPISKIEIEGNSSVKVVNSSLIHWALAENDVGPSSCIKVDIVFIITYEITSDVEAILLNGQSVYSTNDVQRKSMAIFKNNIFPNATERDCSSFFHERDGTWYTPYKGNSMWFLAQTHPGSPAGLVVDVVFEEEIDEFRVWRLVQTKIKANHWRVHNMGWPNRPNGSLIFDFQVHYPVHYYVKPVGIKINNEVLCGLASPPSFLLHNETSITNGKEKRNYYVQYLQLLISVILVVVSILVTVTIFTLILIRKMKKVLEKREPLYDWVQPQNQYQPNSGYSNPTNNSEATKPELQGATNEIYLTVIGDDS